MSAAVSTTVNYGPQAVVAAKPILPTQRRPPAASTGEQRARGHAWSKEKAENLEKDLSKWFDDAVEYSTALSLRYGNKPDFYLRRMFTGGASMLKGREPSAYNAWAHNLAKEAKENADPGESVNLMDLKRDRADEYYELTAAQKRDLVEGFKDVRDSRSMGLRVNPRGRAQDVNTVCTKIEDMFVGLKCRAGVEGFYCIFKNNSEIRLRPRWYFTSPQLNRYLTGTIKKWDVEKIGAMGEAFSIAGCDLMAFLRNGKARADWLKGEIRDKVNGMLAKITGNTKAVMQYKSYDKEIVCHYGIELVGWTHDVFACPSSLPTTLEPLKILLDAIDNGACHFRRLDTKDLAERRRVLEAKVAEGAVPARKERHDKGKRRGPYRPRKKASRDEDEDREEDEEHGEEEEESGPRRKRRRVAVAEESGDDE
ncbi:hypothetical protein OH76DRAFT_1487325 [Lentinus brumalis]|uniref:Uncharacterized protein n=1 Tax=Lentinus brumalis TaxID=2498619 RepID=A0A371CV10_9APHY|nr:hypothetical protein OH76DRAFT_1487325 [Polyporus brumalis]